MCVYNWSSPRDVVFFFVKKSPRFFSFHILSVGVRVSKIGTQNTEKKKEKKKTTKKTKKKKTKTKRSLSFFLSVLYLK